MTLRPQIEQSLQAGILATSAGRLEVAFGWFDRAARLAPANPTLAFLRAVAQARLDPKAALTSLTELQSAWPEFRDAPFARADAIRRLSGSVAAAGVLSAALHRFGIPPYPEIRTLADQVCRETGTPGWVSLAGPSLLTVSTLSMERAGVLLGCQNDMVVFRRPWAAGDQRVVQVRSSTAFKLDVALIVTLDHQPLLGSGLRPAILLRVDAVLSGPRRGRLHGHAWTPGLPDAKPTLTMRGPALPARRFTVAARPRRMPWHPLSEMRPFSLPMLAEGPVHVIGPDGQDIPGSPAYPMAQAPPRLPAPQGGLDVVIPVSRGVTNLRGCLAAMQGSLPPGTRVVVVDDGSTGDGAVLARLAEGEPVIILHDPGRRGRAAAINAGLRHANGRDVLLLDADTLLPPGAIGRLAAAVRAAPDIGSATPFGNAASVLSYPAVTGGNDALRGAALRQMDRLCQTVNHGRMVDLPAGLGFCLYMRAECLAASGGVREDLFAQGDGEVTEWCLRSAALGWRHVLAADVYASHCGDDPGAVRSPLRARSQAVLNREHPGYDADLERFARQDPLATMRRDLDMARWKVAGAGPAILLITHDAGGGVARFVQDRCGELRIAGYRTLVLAPAGEGRVAVQAGEGGAYPNLRFRLPEEEAILLAWLRRQRIERVELHHLLRHPPAVATLAKRLRLPLDIVVHDHMFICPRITLVGRGDRYCGEPMDTSVCDACVAELGSSIPDGAPVATLRARSASLFAAARTVIVPCQDVARRVRRHTKATPIVRPWQDDAALPPRAPPPPGRLRVAVLGAINQAKGLDVLGACARAARDQALPIEFVLIGFSSDDKMLLDAGVFVTGEFAPDEAQSLLRRERPGIGFLPSVKPETWCYALTTMWEAGLDVLSFDIGAQAERTRATGRGRLLPFGVSPDRVLTTLIAMQSH